MSGGIGARLHPNAISVSSFFTNISDGYGNKTLLMKAASSWCSREHHRRRIHRKKCHCNCYPAGLAAGWKQSLCISRAASSSVSAKPLAQLTSNAELSAIVQRFPPEIDYAFGYGSGVLRQQPSVSQTNGNSSNTNSGMVDIIIATRNPHAWHKRNLRCHSDHYSLMARIGGPQFVTWLQVNFGAKLYFHPFVDVDISLHDSDYVGDPQSNGTNQSDIAKTTPKKLSIRRQIKYGVVSTDDLIHDLIRWDYLYLAGRMHKPIVSIDLPPKLSFSERIEEEAVERADEIEDAQRTNLLSAVSASLLLQDAADNEQSLSPLQSLPLSQLYSTIASLSYTGDFRMQTGAEDPNKVKKLVESPGMTNLWENMYSGTLGELQSIGLLSIVDACQGSDDVSTDALNPDGGGKQLEFCFADLATRKQLVQNIPPRLRRHSDQIVGTGDKKSITQGSLKLRQELANIVAPAARSQSVKGFLTAGVSKSWRYAMAKFAKGSGK